MNKDKATSKPASWKHLELCNTISSTRDQRFRMPLLVSRYTLHCDIPYVGGKRAGMSLTHIHDPSPLDPHPTRTPLSRKSMCDPIEGAPQSDGQPTTPIRVCHPAQPADTRQGPPLHHSPSPPPSDGNSTEEFPQHFPQLGACKAGGRRARREHAILPRLTGC
jgi:hypothetical protein